MAKKEQQKVGFVYQFSAPGLAGTIQLEGPDALKVLAHPLRSSLLREMRVPRSVKDLADALEVPAARLYHHIKLLEKSGLVVVVEQRRAGSNVENVYRLAAARIEVAGTVGASWSGPGASTSGLVQAQGRFREAVESAAESRANEAQAGTNPFLEPWLVEAIASLDEEQAERVVVRLRDAIQEVRETINIGPPKHGRRFGIQLIFTPFPAGKANRWSETRRWELDAEPASRPPASERKGS